ncbi:2-hydroxyacid dehydrogenase [Consotaella salsifontis]|uniref:Glyoxylate reductase/D-3-phosphoglycerate dehydrogenase n=1 Tax=Consotaella salsifontis TaxID=1365950 RepID=A0A1T4RLN0_9HYPH|nr:NAD(P)-dependent oxidoreductase [Consotaella salsifontis]SKA16900.1 glyoxylate reductase/D-3-phosphoglycerate dehydrogenase [Consotaella salsifontis]
MHKVVLITRLNRVADIFRSAVPTDFEVFFLPMSATEEEKIAAVRDAEFIVLQPADISSTVIGECRKLRLLQLLGAGYDQIDLGAVAERGALVATNGGANAWAVAEHTIAMLLALYRRLTACDASVRAGTWRRPATEFGTFEVAGKTLGIAGAGTIGKKVAHRLKAFETEIVYFDPVARPELEQQLQARRVSLEELLRVSDIVSLHLPLTKETANLIGREQLALMKANAVLLNPSRGEIVDEAALVEALREGRIAGAGLDVFQREPVAPDNPLLRLDNVVLSPHSAGHSYEGWFRRSSFSWENIQRVVSGEMPTSIAR